jgi:periplasmic protein TonB
MFEGTLVESRGLVDSGTRKWTAAGSLTFQCVLAGVLLAIPLLRPQMLRIPAVSAPLAAPFLRRQPVVTVRHVNAAIASSAMSVPATGSTTVVALGPTIWPHPGVTESDDAPMRPTGVGMREASTLLGISEAGTRPEVVVVGEKRSGPVTISSGVTQGMLLEPIRPVYPSIARAAGVKGTVVMEAVISKVGRIESLHTVSGPAMLRPAAIDAVSAARYRPYLLNGQPTEVETTITVVFQLGG